MTCISGFYIIKEMEATVSDVNVQALQRGLHFLLYGEEGKENEMEEKNKMGTMAMPKLVINMSLPLMISLLVQSLYNIVDSIFVARMGEAALTAVSLAFPVQILMVAFSVGTSVGLSALLSHSLGAGDRKTAGNTAASGVLLALAGMAVFMILGIFCSGTFVRLFTEDPEIGAYCEEYLFICMVFCGGTFLSTMYQRFLQSVGDTFDSMITLVSGAVTNTILDPIMIFGWLGLPAMGVRGAAIATVIGQWVSALLAILLNRFRNPEVKVRFRGYRPDPRVFREIYRVGLPTIVTQALGSIMVTAVNGIMISFSSTAVAFFGVYYKLQNFLCLPMNGLGQASIPIAGYNLGAGKKERVLQLLKTVVPIGAGVGIAAALLFAALPAQLLGLFSASREMLELGVPALRIICGTFPLAAVTIVMGYTISGLGNGVINMLGTALRQLVLLVPAVYLFSRYLGIAYAWYGFWVSETAAVICCALLVRRELRRKGILQAGQKDSVC